jgi:hypothetical protein
MDEEHDLPCSHLSCLLGCLERVIGSASVLTLSDKRLHSLHLMKIGDVFYKNVG